MTEVKSGPLPRPAAVVTGFDTAHGQSVAAALARAGHRLCVLHAEESSSAHVAGLPGHDKLRHESIRVDLGNAALVQGAALEAQRRLGQVTALVHVALGPERAAAAEPFDPTAFAREIQLGAGAWLALGLALLPEMLATQTGCLSVLLGAPARASFSEASVGAAASLGAMLGAVRQLADRCQGTALRSIALCLDTGAALGAAELSALVREVGAERKAESLDNGAFLRLGAPGGRGDIEFLRPPRVQAAPAAAVAVPVALAAAGAARRDRVAEKLAQTFRSVFGLAPGADVSGAAIGSVPRWDSLGHLKLMMEVEQALRVRLPAEALSRVQSYRDLEQAVRAYLPVE